MKSSLGISNYLEEIASLSHSTVFLYFFALITEAGFLISPFYSLELCIQWIYLSFSSLPSPVWPLPICLDHWPNIPGSYAILLFYSIRSCFHYQSHPQPGVVFALALSLHSFSGIISPLISSSILGTYRPGEFIFQCPIFLPFHTVHGVPKARILKWFTIPFSSGLHFVRTLHHDLSILGGPTGHGS